LKPAFGRDEHVLVLAPRGRDGAIACAILREAKLDAGVCANLYDLVVELEKGAGAAVIAEEGLNDGDYPRLVSWIESQPSWSDMAVVLLASRGAGLERNPGAQRLAQALGNVSFVERPFHPTTLVSMVQAALRGRRRQYEARERLETIRAAEESLERRVAERTAELESANRQLASQIVERERVESALHHAQRLEAVGQLTSGVAHDFNNLLTVVLGNIHQLQRAERDAQSRRRLKMMAEAAERGAKLTAQMLAFSRRQKLDPRPVDLNETVQRMHDLLQSTIGGSVAIVTELQPDLWPALIDPTQIELVILNLAINARDAMSVGGQLTVRTDNVIRPAPVRPEEPPAGEYVLVEVRDTGEGMSEEVLARVFEPFFTTKEVGKGSGLGLSQVYGLAKQSGGGVRIESAPGEGCSVQLYLPRSQRAPAGADGDRPAVAADGRTDRRVLVVDDDPAVREVTAGFLADLGYGVIEAGSGGAALEVLDRRGGVDLLLLDFAMPGMNGAELAREARARHPELPIVFLTGYADTRALPQLGQEEILHKPFSRNELAKKVGEALGVGG
jgi:signal transduction histidine kinase